MSDKPTREQAVSACCELLKLLLVDELQSEELRRHILQVEALYYRHGSGDLFGLLSEAQRDPWSFDVAATLAAYFVDKGEALPVALRSFAAAVLCGEAEKPKKQGNRRQPGKHLRNIAICASIWKIERMGWTPITRNEATSAQNSAIDIAAEALESTLNLNLSYGAIDTIWKDSKNTPPNISKIFHVIAREQLHQEPRDPSCLPGITPPDKPRGG